MILIFVLSVGPIGTSIICILFYRRMQENKVRDVLIPVAIKLGCKNGIPP